MSLITIPRPEYTVISRGHEFFQMNSIFKNGYNNKKNKNKRTRTRTQHTYIHGEHIYTYTHTHTLHRDIRYYIHTF